MMDHYKRSSSTTVYIRRQADLVPIGEVADEPVAADHGAVTIPLTELRHVQDQLQQFFHFLRTPHPNFGDHIPGDYLPVEERARLALLSERYLGRWIRAGEKG